MHRKDASHGKQNINQNSVLQNLHNDCRSGKTEKEKDSEITVIKHIACSSLS